MTGSGSSSVHGNGSNDNVFDITPSEREELELLRTLISGLSVE